MIETGLIHGAIGGLAFSLLFLDRGAEGIDHREDRRAGDDLAGRALDRWSRGRGDPRRRLLLHPQGLERKVPQAPQGQPVHPQLELGAQGGLIADGAGVALIGIFFVVAAWQACPSETGGLERTFGWLSS
jgi:hypothetical protein